MTGIVFLEDRRRANVLEKVIRRTCHTSHNTLAEHSWVACERSRRFRSRQSSINIDSTSIEILARSIPWVVGRYENAGREFRHRGRSPILSNVNLRVQQLGSAGKQDHFRWWSLQALHRLSPLRPSTPRSWLGPFFPRLSGSRSRSVCPWRRLAGTHFSLLQMLFRDGGRGTDIIRPHTPAEYFHRRPITPPPSPVIPLSSHRSPFHWTMS